MPRIDPLQLLKCLSVLLTPDGGILSRDEVPRLVNLMTKFSKKLVSKCVYVLILKSTENELVDMFMAEGGWTLIQNWLQDAIQTSNWDLVREILGLLLVTPVDVERLKLNILPKLIKSLSRRAELEGVADLSSKLVQQWLSIVKGNTAQQQIQPQLQVQSIEVVNSPMSEATNGIISVSTENKLESAEPNEEGKIEYINEDGNSNAINTGTFYKTSGKDGKLVIRKSSTSEDAKDEDTAKVNDDKAKDDKKERERRSSSSKSSRSSSKSSGSKEKNKDKPEEKDKDKKGSSKSSSSSSSSSKSHSSSSSSSKSKSSSSGSHKSSSSSSKDKDKKDRDRDKDKDGHRKNGEVKSSTSSSKSDKDRRDPRDKDRDKDKHKKEENKEKQAEKDKDTLAQIKPPAINKLGRIPKKSGSSEEDKAKANLEAEMKKKTFSVGIRKDRDTDERPKTVKIFNSKMRSTGLEEEVKPAPPRSSGKKPTPSVSLPTIPQKRPSPPKDIRDPIVPPEKKLKIDKIEGPERPGAIKLIPPKPKPAFLQESDLFNDALTAAMTTKKEVKKRKRRPSITKDNKEIPSSPTTSQTSESATPTSPTITVAPSSSSPLGIKNIAPINFYQDTLSEETEGSNENDIKNNDENKENALENPDEKPNVGETKVKAKDESPYSPPKTPTDDAADELDIKRPKLQGGLRGVLLYTKKKGPKRSISWKNDSDLVEIRYFELDETERVNVTKSFGDMAKMEMSSERDAIQLSRKLGGEDLMEPQIVWRVPFVIELDEPLAAPGSKSLEKDIQFAREKSVLQALYFDKRRIPDSPEEPIPENHQMSDPVTIPLDDPESQEIDLRTTPWPEPKGIAPQPEPQQAAPIFQNVPAPFQPPFANMTPPAFPGMPPRFTGPAGPMGPVVPGAFIPPGIMPNANMMGPPNQAVPPHELLNINPNMFPPGALADGFVPGPIPDGFGPGPDGFRPGPDGFGPGPDGFGPGPDGFGPGPDFPMFPNQNQHNMNMFPSNKFNNHRQNNRGGNFRRGGGGNSGGWKVVSGNSNNWKRGRGGRLCKNVQNHGFCRNRDNCPFVHP